MRFVSSRDSMRSPLAVIGNALQKTQLWGATPEVESHLVRQDMSRIGRFMRNIVVKMCFFLSNSDNDQYKIFQNAPCDLCCPEDVKAEETDLVRILYAPTYP